MDELKLPPIPASIADARQFVAQATSPSHPELADVACLAVSELATNAIRHGATYFTVGVETLADGVRVTVSDGGEGLPVRREPGPKEPHGRGLQIVSALADSWGVSDVHDVPGKSVWFEVRSALT